MAVSLPIVRNRQKRKPLTRLQRRTITFYTFIIPWLLGVIFLVGFPLAIAVLVSFTNFDGMNLDTVKFVGINNYTRSFTDPDVKFSFERTIFWGLANLPTWLGLSFLLAVILNQDVKGRSLFRMAFYLPSIIPGVAAINAWKIILDRNFGLLNGFISIFRPGTAIGWLSDYALPGMTAIAVWGGLGGGMIVFLAGLQDIPEELVEAARIDGANSLQIFRHITIPLMTPVIFYMLIQGLIGSFQQLNLPLIITNIASGQTSVPPRPIYLFMIHVYRQIFVSGRYGYGTALLWILFIIVLLLTGLVFWSAKFWVLSTETPEGGRK